MITQPMLSATLEDPSMIKFPVLITPKLDGIRCLIKDGKPVSRNFKDIPNRHVQKTMTGLPEGLDGELIMEGIGFNGTQSAIMSEDGEPDFKYYVFDYVPNWDSLSEPYVQRMNRLDKTPLPDFCEYLLPSEAETLESLNHFEKACVETGYEGVMIRSFNGPYKCGRSTPREGYLSKWKRFLDSEAEIIGFEEEMRNDNAKEKDETGHTKRSSRKENLVPKGILGSLVVRDIKNGIEFKIGTGIDHEIRQKIWDDREAYLGKIVKYQYQKIEKDKPRFPSWIGFRDPRDM